MHAEHKPRDSLAWPRRVGVLALLLLALALRWPGMTESIWYDEWCRTGQVLNAASLPSILLHDVHNPLYNAFMYLWISLLGDSEISIRTPSLLAGLGSLWLLCRWIAGRLGEPLAWLVGLWAVCSPQHVWFSTEAKNNMFVVAAATLVLTAYSRVGAGRPRAAVGSVGAGVLALYTDWVTLLGIAPALVWAARQRPCGPRRAAAVAAATAALALPLVLLKSRNIEELWRDYLKPFRSREAIELLGGDFLTGNAWAPDAAHLGPALLALPAVLILLLLGARRLARARDGRLVNATLVLGIALMAAAAALIDAVVPGLKGRIYQPRNLLLLLYPYGTVLLAGTLSLRWARGAAAALVIGVSLASSLSMVTLNRDRATVMNPNPDWREIARRIDADAPGRALTVWSRSPVFPVSYYLPRARVVSSWGGPLDPAALNHTGPIYIVDDRRWSPLDTADRGALDGAGFERLFTVGHIDVYRTKP